MLEFCMFIYFLVSFFGNSVLVGYKSCGPWHIEKIFSKNWSFTTDSLSSTDLDDLVLICAILI